jgi:hypothetical protein
MQKEILDKLYEPFELKARPGQGGMTFKYVPSDDIVDRMNKVFMGDWSTEVVQSEVIGDQVLIRVRVYAKDPNNSDSNQYWHEGYASQLIAKYTQGPKAGQIIDVGNSYKSAMSKAIKTAVAKWGVGLYLEKGSVNEGSSAGSWGPPNIPTSPPVVAPVEQPTIAPVAPPVVPPVAAPIAAPVATPIAVAPVVPPVAAPVNIPSGMPNIPFDTPVQAPAAAPVSAPIFTDANVVVTQPNQSASFNPPTDSIPVQGSMTEGLTDVQKVAIENIMSVHSKSFAELAPLALQRTDNLPNSLEALSYQDAVKLIQYGNNLNAGS